MYFLRILEHFNPLPPHGGRRNCRSNWIRSERFQSTPSAWRETQALQSNSGSYGISIHSLRMEGDQTDSFSVSVQNVFQSTPSAWRETAVRIERRCKTCISIHSLRMEGDYKNVAFVAGEGISIHSLRMEGDIRHRCNCLPKFYFNPLPPHGGRRDIQLLTANTVIFQSTPSAWRETSLFSKHFTNVHISIHSLRMEGDCFWYAAFRYVPGNFNPLPPHGGRRSEHSSKKFRCHFNPLPPHGGRPVYIIAHL